jgi:hypothetical protein
VSHPESCAEVDEQATWDPATGADHCVWHALQRLADPPGRRSAPGGRLRIPTFSLISPCAPNRLGEPKNVFYSTDRYDSAAEAERHCRLGGTARRAQRLVRLTSSRRVTAARIGRTVAMSKAVRALS